MLENTRYLLKTAKKLTVSYFGGSITEMKGWRGMTESWMREAFPEAEITNVNSAIGGTGSFVGLYRCDRDVIAHKPDLVFFEFSVNDGFACDYDSVSVNSESIFRKLRRANPYVDIIIVYTITKAAWDAYTDGRPSVARQAHDDLGRHYNLPRIDMGIHLAYAVNRAGGDWTIYAPDTVHPGEGGHRFCADAVIDVLQPVLSGEAPEALKEHVMPEPKNTADSLKTDARLLDAASLINCGSGRGQKGWTLVDKPLCGRYEHYIESDDIGSALELRFTGREVGVYWMLAKDGGDIICSLDGGEEKTVRAWDRYCLNFNRISLPLLYGNLAPGEHVLRLRVAGTKHEQSEGNKIRIAAFGIS